MPGWEREKKAIENAVKLTWGKVSLIEFEGWGTCPDSGSPSVRMKITEAAPRTAEAQTSGTGVATLTTQGVSINFFLRPDTPLDRIRYLAIHEFGHVLGLNHEDDSPERDPSCTTQQPWPNCTQIGAWDRHSIMNSGCNDYRNRIGYLSKGDIWTIRSIYGIHRVTNRGDFNGDSLADWGIWRPSDGMWLIDGGATAPKVWGQNGDIPVPGDYNGNGKTDRAIWRPSTGEWFIDRLNGALNVTRGIPGDIPVPGDYLGEGLSRPVLFRPSSGEWLFPGPRPAFFPDPFVLGGVNDIPVPGSFSGNGIIEPAVWNRLEGRFRFANGFTTLFGQSGDIPLPKT